MLLRLSGTWSTDFMIFLINYFWNYALQGILSIILNSVEFQIQTRTNHMIGEVPIFLQRRKIGTDHCTLESRRLNSNKHTIKIEEILWKSLDLYFLCEKFNTNEKHAAVVQLHCTIICVRNFFGSSWLCTTKLLA